MPHLKHLFGFTRQKRDNISTAKMLHQMSVWIVVVALGLVLITITHLFSRAQKKDFPFFPVGRPRPEPSQNRAPARCLFSTRKSRFEVPERGDLGDFGEEHCLGKGGVDRAKKKKGKKDAQKKVGLA